ncbi:MAG: tetratricopeptide repeat protein [Terriglobales bacterium]
MSPKPCDLRRSLSLPRSAIVVVLLLSGTLLFGQGKHPPSSPIPAIPGTQASAPPSPFDLDQTNVVVDGSGKTIATNEYACFLPPLNSVPASTVGVVDLQVPWKPHFEYQSGCDALHKKKIADAEKHLRKAVGQYQKYAAAWVLLGQLLEVQQKPEEALDACSKSLNASIKYLPGYLCLTDISARQKKWDDVLKFSQRVLDLDPTTNPVAYAYNATANLNLHHLLEAEKSALKALEIDVRNSEPRVHFLLAQIYAAKGDRPNAVAQLREYLRFAKDPDDVAMVKNDLAKFDGEVAK